MNIRGVDNGHQQCTRDCFLPIALRTKNGKNHVLGSFTTPRVQNSQLPGLMGLNALRKSKALVDFGKMEVHFCGPAGYDLEARGAYAVGSLRSPLQRPQGY